MLISQSGWNQKRGHSSETRHARYRLATTDCHLGEGPSRSNDTTDFRTQNDHREIKQHNSSAGLMPI